MITAYQLLGVPENASNGEIIRAYRKGMLKFHPDRNSGVSAEEKARQLNRAKDLLVDPVKRARYDEYLRSQRASATRTTVDATLDSRTAAKNEYSKAAVGASTSSDSGESVINEFEWLNAIQGDAANPPSNENSQRPHQRRRSNRSMHKRRKRGIPLFVSIPIGGVIGIILAGLLLKLVFDRDIVKELYATRNATKESDVRELQRSQHQVVQKSLVPGASPLQLETELLNSTAESESSTEQSASAPSVSGTSVLQDSTANVQIVNPTAVVGADAETPKVATNAETLVSLLPRLQASASDTTEMSERDSAEIQITGTGFALKSLRTKQQMFSNRTIYPWKLVPKELTDWVFTYTSVGAYPNYQIEVKSSGNVYMLVAAERAYDPEHFEDTKLIFDSGWLPKKLVFANFGPYVLFSRRSNRGEVVEIPHFHTFSYSIIAHPESCIVQ